MSNKFIFQGIAEMTDFKIDLNREKMNRAHVQTLTFPTNPHLFSLAFNFMSMMHARPNRPPKENNCQIALDLRG